MERRILVVVSDLILLIPASTALARNCLSHHHPVGSSSKYLQLPIYSDIVDMGSVHQPRVLIVGVGPHAQRTYVPHLRRLEASHGPMIKALIDVEEKTAAVTEWAHKACPEAHLDFVPLFTTRMPADIQVRLDRLVSDLDINGVIIATEPLAHKEYAMWAMRHGLHIMMDKPITTRVGAGTDGEEAKGIATDYHDLLEVYCKLQERQTTSFVVSSHRRFNPLVIRAREYIREVIQRTGCPVTSVSASYADGTFRLPIEVVHQDYHTYKQGYGKVSHSGYHIIDIACEFAKAGFIPSKRPDEVEVISSFILPRGFFRMMGEADYQKLFGKKEYSAACSLSEQELMQRVRGYGELDAVAQLTFCKERDPVMLAQISMSSNGYSLRTQLAPSKDQYKGSGRVKHEAYEIKCGPFQSIYIESRSIKDSDEPCSPGDYQVGANNHFEMRIFRNHELTGHPLPLEVLHLADLADDAGYDHTKLYTEQAKENMVLEFVRSIKGELLPSELTSNIDDHQLPVEIMSAMYSSHIRYQARDNPLVSVRGV